MKSGSGLFLRHKEMDDDEFVQLVKKKIMKRKQVKFLWPILAVLFLITIFYLFLIIDNTTFTSNTSPIQKWSGSIVGFIWGGIGFSSITFTIIAVMNWCEAFQIHRTENLLVKYYEFSKK